MKDEPFDELLRWRSPKRVDEMFDLVCVNNYFRGQFGLPIQVDKSREVFKRIKEILQNAKISQKIK